MTIFATERSLKGISMEDLGAAQTRAIETARHMSEDGTRVSYIRSVFRPETGACTCLFEADDAGTVEQLNRDAEIPFDRVTEAMDLPG